MPVTVIIGIGPGNGQALARRFAAAGHRLALLSRGTDLSEALVDELGGLALACDVTDPASVSAAFAAIREGLGPVDTLVYNVGSGAFTDFAATDAANMERAWRIDALGGLLASKEVVPAMLERGSGNIVFMGATASRRGGARSTAFASAKAAQRSLAQSMARDLGPRGVHVSLVVIDGVIDRPRAREGMPEAPDAFFLKPEAIAETVFQLTEQHPSAWTHELEVRPFGEKW